MTYLMFTLLFQINYRYFLLRINLNLNFMVFELLYLLIQTLLHICSSKRYFSSYFVTLINNFAFTCLTTWKYVFFIVLFTFRYRWQLNGEYGDDLAQKILFALKTTWEIVQNCSNIHTSCFYNCSLFFFTFSLNMIRTFYWTVFNYNFDIRIFFIDKFDFHSILWVGSGCRCALIFGACAFISYLLVACEKSCWALVI